MSKFSVGSFERRSGRRSGVLLSMTLLFTALLGLSQAQADAPPAPAPTPVPAPINKCAEISKTLDQVYQNLYNVDTRPLTIDNYRIYRDSIQVLHDQIGLLQTLCGGAIPPSAQETLYKTKDFSWYGAASYENPCASADLSAVLSEFQETATRECYSAGYSECSTKLSARAFAINGVRNSNLTWNCSAKLDLVLTVKK